MRRTLPTPASTSKPVLALVLALSLGACGTDSTELVDAPAVPTPGGEVAAATGGAGVDKLPVEALPEVDRDAGVDCPYLDTAWVADTNGQRVTGHGVDTRFGTPACVFWSYPEEPQVTVIVREMGTAAAAIEVVDWAAPVDSTEPAEEPSGWSGGRRGGTAEQGALYAVQKDTWAVVVFSNQDQSVKAQAIAEETITNLGL